MNSLVILNNESESIKYLVSRDKRLAKVIEKVGTITYVPYEDGFSFLVNQIIGQMLANKVASVLQNRLVDLCQGSVTVEKITEMDEDTIKSIGISSKKAYYIKQLALYLRDNSNYLGELKFKTNDYILRELTRF
ncbi:hypothetical protein [Kandleria vitulina]|uniref:hypothetical protein n=1 Tax=Kandleria vitulina TaxID=1630 RepID=UPI0006882507|nr:hypothetical protein [Kandleria vitulina]